MNEQNDQSQLAEEAYEVVVDGETSVILEAQPAQQTTDTVFAQVCAQADRAADAQRALSCANSGQKNALLLAIADALVEHASEIEQANAIDYSNAQAEGMDAGKLDRLLFTVDRIQATAQGVRDVAALADPVGEVIRGNTMPNGMRLNQVRVPLGVVGMIYEARPNVTIDVAALGLKSGNAVILRGGHAAEHTNQAILSVIAEVMAKQGFDASLVSSVDQFGRAGAQAMMRARGHIDVLVPRGGAGLIREVVDHSLVPVIETGSGNVHIYIDESADPDIVVPIIVNAKTQRVGVCNAAEKLLIHHTVAESLLPDIAYALTAHGVRIHADEASLNIITSVGIDGLDIVPATEDDWSTEYLDYEIGIRIVQSMPEAIAHINRYSTGHTEAIISEDYTRIEVFTHLVDSAVVMVNASTRFTDGSMFGLGAELGISTQKMHARGPMGLAELTCTKWIAYGTGQVRE